MLIAIWTVFALVKDVSPLSIPDKLNSPFASDCFKRISIGQRLLYYDVTRTVRKNTVKGCEEECNIYECTFFSFGISTGGNGTCELSTGREISKRQATDYDLYQRTKECSSGKPTGYEEGSVLFRAFPPSSCPGAFVLPVSSATDFTFGCNYRKQARHLRCHL